MTDLGEIMREEGGRYLDTRFTTADQRKAIRAITGCRTEAMGSVSATCEECHAEYRLFRSCRNRSCPQCQSEARSTWLAARQAELLPVPYLQVVFNVPAEFERLASYCPETIYDVLMRSAGQALIDVGWSRLHAQLGCLMQLHTWGQNLARHLHTHCVVPCGGFSKDGRRWISLEPDDFPVKALSTRFRTLLCRAIRAAAREGKLERLPDTVSLDHVLAVVIAHERTVYAKPPFGGPEQLLAYLAQYTHRVAITNERIESYENHQVTFRWHDYRDGKDKTCTLEAMEFLRRFLQHVPPTGFVRIRSYGFMANRNRKQHVDRARQLIGRSGTPRPRKPLEPIRLCPQCYAARRHERIPHFAPDPDVAPQLNIPHRPPPIHRLVV